MNEKQIGQLFDSSVRKLRKIIGTEGQLVYVGDKNLFNEDPSPLAKDSMAMCVLKVDYTMFRAIGVVALNTDVYLEVLNQYELSESASKACVQNTVCHEMSHFLEFNARIRFYRNAYVHDPDYCRDAIEEFIGEEWNGRSIDETHGWNWHQYMEEFGAKHTPYRWSPCPAPKIFAR